VISIKEHNAASYYDSYKQTYYSNNGFHYILLLLVPFGFSEWA
jgi:hypothetical protein